MNKRLPILFCAVLTIATLSFAGCAANHATSKIKDPAQIFAGSTDDGTILYPIDYFVYTNATGGTFALPEYAAIINTNRPPFSFKTFFFGHKGSLLVYSDSPQEIHRGGGTALLVDSKYNQFDSQFQEIGKLGGNSHKSIGSVELIVNTNAITATGNAASKIIESGGSAAGQILNKAVTGTGTPGTPQ